MDHGIDWLGDNEQQEELNHIVKGHKYGWPYVFADSKYNPQDEPPGGISMAEWAAQSTGAGRPVHPARRAHAAGLVHRRAVSSGVQG